eukprot:TRINITY_DN714_c0_g1_i6.p1 TRINITY_DN714_c0_g1~~TRINITY_DN714_c0_g1_i6.p1  ORF type:complete len:114 (-),score=27.39 TRINITY_DN714_c0_g1_i6:266-607(-)
MQKRSLSTEPIPSNKKRKIETNVSWADGKKILSKEDIQTFEKRAALINKRVAKKSQYLFKVEPSSVPEGLTLWRKVCLRGLQTLRDLHEALQVALELNDTQPHRVRADDVTFL